jgi:TRAP-type mannitol/chloroaromatic compound transport system permease small subunit
MLIGFLSVKLIQKIADLCQCVADSLWVLLLITLPLCASISAGNAFIRKIYDVGSNSLLELQWYLFSAVFLLGAGTVLKHDGHIRIDIFYAKMSDITKAKMNIFLHLVITIPMLIFVIYLCMPFFLLSISPADTIISIYEIPYYIMHSNFHEISANAGGLPTWYAKILLPLGFIFLLCAVIADTLNKIIFINTQANKQTNHQNHH